MRELGACGRMIGIAMSGFGAEDDRRRSREAGFFEHLTKPVSLDRLDAAIRRATAGTGGLEEGAEPYNATHVTSSRL